MITTRIQTDRRVELVNGDHLLAEVGDMIHRLSQKAELDWATLELVVEEAEDEYLFAPLFMSEIAPPASTRIAVSVRGVLRESEDSVGLEA